MKSLKLLKNLSMRQVRVFLSAARHGSFAKAAIELNLTAPAISMQIKELENDMSIALFARVGRRVELTTAGEYFWCTPNGWRPTCATPKRRYPTCAAPMAGR
jgi:predicted transcriptional regulator